MGVSIGSLWIQYLYTCSLFIYLLYLDSKYFWKTDNIAHPWKNRRSSRITSVKPPQI